MPIFNGCQSSTDTNVDANLEFMLILKFHNLSAHDCSNQNMLECPFPYLSKGLSNGLSRVNITNGYIYSIPQTL